LLEGRRLEGLVVLLERKGVESAVGLDVGLVVSKSVDAVSFWSGEVERDGSERERGGLWLTG
jgi:hypothetical protein